MVEINTIKNKLKREELYQKQKSAKAKHKRDRRTALQKEESSNPEKKEVPQNKDHLSELRVVAKFLCR